MAVSSNGNGPNKMLWRIIPIAVSLLPLIVAGSIQLVKLWSIQDVQADRLQRLEQYVNQYIVEHGKRHQEDRAAQREKDKEQEQHLRATDARLEVIRDIQMQRGEAVTKVKDLEQAIYALHGRIQRLEDRFQGPPR